MQTTMKIETATIQPVHIKVTYGDETRRFLFENPSYEGLISALKTFFALHPATVLDLKYQDDEEDWVTILSEEEFVYAASLATSTLRLRITISCSPEQKLAVKVEEKVSDFPDFPRSRGGKCKWGRGKWMEEMDAETKEPGLPQYGFPRRGKCQGGRGARGRRGCFGPQCGGKKFGREPFNKSEKVAHRIAMIQAKIESGEISEDRLPVLKFRLEKLQQKLEFSREVLGDEKTPKPSNTRSERLTFRIAQLQAKIDSGELPEERVRMIKSRLECMKEKQARLEKFSFKNGPHPGPHHGTSVRPERGDDQERRMARFDHRIEMIKNKIESGELPEERVRMLLARMDHLKAKRDQPWDQTNKFRGCGFGRNPEKIAARIATIQAKIDSGELSDDKVTILRGRLSQLEAKLEAARALQDQPLQEEKPCARRCGPKNPEKLAARIAKIQEKIDSGELPEKRVAVLKCRLEKLQGL